MKATEFPSHLKWLNTDEPLSLDALKGHVVLLDFWIYCCVNCMHVLQDLAYLEKKYGDQPFIVVGVHSAKFENERKTENIRQAISRYQIEHPVINDHHHEIMDAYGIESRPSLVLIGPDGDIIKKEEGEGHRDAFDFAIDGALKKGKSDGSLTNNKIYVPRPEIPERTLAFPGKLTHDPATNYLYTSDSNHNRILELEFTNEDEVRIVRTIGSGTAGLSDGTFSTASFYRPQGMSVKDGVLYVCDTENHAIRRVNLATETVTTVAGTGSQSKEGALGGYGQDTNLNSPWDSVIVDDYLYIAMAGPHQLWRLHLTSGYIEICAGNSREGITDGAAYVAELAQPSGLTTDGQTIYFADSETSALRTFDIRSGEVNTLVGTGLFDFGREDGSFAAASLQHPLGVTYHQGKVFIADSYNHSVRTADLSSEELSTIIARSSSKVCSIFDKNCNVLALNEPNDVLVINGNMYITDTNNHLIRFYDTKTNELKELKIANDSAQKQAVLVN